MLTDPVTVLQTVQPILSPSIVALLAMVELRDSYTHAHGARVAYYCMRIAHVLKLDAIACQNAYTAGLLHDVGKFRTPTKILHKPGPLTKSEHKTMEPHAALGSLVVSFHFPHLTAAVRAHHEHYDGSGYPDKLAGEAIPLLGRIIAVADSYDAMTSDRPYRKGMAASAAGTILLEGRGTQWDADIVAAFLESRRQDGAL